MLFGIFILGLSTLLGLQSPNQVLSAPNQYVIKFATVAPEGSSWMKFMRELDREIRQKSGGSLAFRLYPGGVAGDELDVLRKIRIGQIHCAGFSGVGFGKILPMVRIMDLPFLFRNYKEVDRVHHQLRPFFAREFRKRGFVLLSWAEVGNVHLFSKRPVRNVKDFSGLKVWVWSGDPIAKATFSALGVNPIPLAVTDVNSGINTGMIDTVYAPPLGALALQWHRSMRYMMALPFAHSTGALLLSMKKFKQLPKALAQILLETADRNMEKFTVKLRTDNEEAIKTIQEAGLKIVPRPSGKALEEFYGIHDEVARKLVGQIYPKKLLFRVYSLLDRP